jgi:hypothetical protein
MTDNVILRRLLALHDGLDTAGLDHAFGGAIALAFHVGEPRATSDIDVNITSDPDDPERVFRALPDQVRWGAPDVAACRQHGQARLWWREDPFDTPVDIFLPQHPRLHAMVVRRAEQVVLLERGIPILTATDLMIFKLWYDRRKDWADIEAMVRHGKADHVEAAEWIAELLDSEDARLVKLREIVDEVGVSRGGES